MAYFSNKFEFVPPRDELDRAQIYKDASVVKESLDSWSEYDLLRAYKDIKESIVLLQDDVKQDIQFDIAQRAIMTLDKVFMTKKNG